MVEFGAGFCEFAFGGEALVVGEVLGGGVDLLVSGGEVCECCGV